MQTDLKSYNEELFTVNQLLEIVEHNFDPMEIMGSFRLTDIVESLVEQKTKTTNGGNLQLENTADFIDEFKTLKSEM